MSAEEMRSDLEAFVNRGLSEGWCGWPMKGPSSCRGALGIAAYATPAAVTLFRGVQEGPLKCDREPAWFGRVAGLDDSSGGAGFGRSELC